MVTGGNGAIGSWVVRELVEKNTKTLSYDMLKDESLLGDLSGKYDYVRGDIRDFFTLGRTVKDKGIDSVIHTAGLIGSVCQSNPLLGLQVNCEGTLNVLEAARLFDIKRIVYFSTKAAYGSPTGEYGHPTYKHINEDHPKNPIKLYEATKFMGENLALNYAHDYGLDVISLKFPALYGPGRVTKHGFFAVIDRLVNNALGGATLKIAGGAEAEEEWCYNKDCARGAVLACLVEKHKHNQYHIGTGESHSMRTVAETVAKVIPGAKIEFGDAADYYGAGFMYNYIFDISRAKEDLGYEPAFLLEKGIRDYVATMQKFGIEPVVT